MRQAGSDAWHTGAVSSDSELQRDADSAIQFAVWPVGSSRVTGSGMIEPGGDRDSSSVRLQLEGLAPNSTHAVSQHHGQSCGAIEASPEFVFSPVVSDSQGKAATLLMPRKPFWRWWNRPHFIVVHWEPSGPFNPMACGEIVPDPALRPADAPPQEEFTAAVQPPPNTLVHIGASEAHAEALDAHAAPLTERELEVLALIATGASTAEIAEALVITGNTVERHVTNLYAKIGARNRSEATAYALRHGLAGVRRLEG